MVSYGVSHRLTVISQSLPSLPDEEDNTCLLNLSSVICMLIDRLRSSDRTPPSVVALGCAAFSLDSSLRECIKPEALSGFHRSQQLLLSISMTNSVCMVAMETSVQCVTNPNARAKRSKRVSRCFHCLIGGTNK